MENLSRRKKRSLSLLFKIRLFVFVAVLSCFMPSIVFSTDRFEKGPAEVWLPKKDSQDDSWMPSIPRGAQVVCYVEISEQDVQSGRFKGAKVETVGSDFLLVGGVEIKTSLNYVPSPHHYKGKAPAIKFSLYVSVKAELGPRSLRITGRGGTTLLALTNTLRVCNPLVVIVDIDGMRRDIFYKGLAYPSHDCSNLRKLIGAPIEGYRHPTKNLSWFEYENGIAVNEAVTVFPTVTYAGHAAIISGCDPGKLNMAGNEWFDRDKDPPYKYAYTGDNIGLTGMGDSYNSFYLGKANERLLDSGNKTVFQEAYVKYGVTSYAGHIMYFGDPANKAAYWERMNHFDLGIYNPVLFGLTSLNDLDMIAKAKMLMLYREYKELADNDISLVSPVFSPWEYDRLGIVTLYFAGLDHTSHKGQEPWHVEGGDGIQATYLKEFIDRDLGLFSDSLSDVTYKNVTFLFTADHGQTTMWTPKGEEGAAHACFSVPRTVPLLHKFQDLLWEAGYHPNGVAPDDALTAAAVPLRLGWTSAVVGLNGGMAHVYLRRLKPGNSLEWRIGDANGYGKELYEQSSPFDSWKKPPTYDEVIRVASWFREQLQEKSQEESLGYYKSLDMILVRNTGGGNEQGYFTKEELEEVWKEDYRVFLGNDQEGKPKTVSLKEYFKVDEGEGRAFIQKNDWHNYANGDADALFLIDRIRRLQGQMSGDLILIPNYPDFYCEYAELYGDHGSLNRTDFEIPFVLVRPGADEHDKAFLRKALIEGIKLDTDINWDKGTKNRPSNTDVKEVVLRLLNPPEREFSQVKVTEGKLRRKAQAE